MVCDKIKDYKHDFRKDPIDYVIKDGWMIAENTTLGADDGIGVAASLALLESSKPMGRLECLFTISEETGMDGAHAMEAGFFSGKTLINLDSEDEGQLFVGCAGGLDTVIDFDCSYDTIAEGYKTAKLRIYNAIGGHSGDDIDKGRMNTLQQLARFLYGELENKFQLIAIKGGNKPNAIARDSEAVIAVPDIDSVIARFDKFGKEVKAEFVKSDPDVIFSASKEEYGDKAIATDVSTRLITSLFAAPHGVLAMSQDIPGLVETSTNLAAVNMTDGSSIQVITSQRSSIDSARKGIAAKVEASFRLAGAIVAHKSEYPGWKPDLSSKILQVCKKSYEKLFGKEPEVKAIHAGLECGLFLTKFPGLDMISFGPTLRGVHAPGERLDLASLDKFVALLDDVVTNFN
jgi:dipeptidase D